MIETLQLLAGRWGHTVQLEATRYLAGAVGVAMLYWLLRRWIEPRRIQDRRATTADRRREVWFSVRTIAIFGFVGMISFGLKQAGIIRIETGASAWLIAGQVVVFAILHDAYFYWMHRGLHLRAMFRRAHADHHLSRTPTSFAAYAFAPIEAITESLYIPVMLAAVSLAIPIAPLAVFLFLGHQIARNAIGHSGHELAWSGFTASRWTGWLTTTTHHDLHHVEGRYNFGLYFTWWDRMMGTEHPHYHARFEAVAARGAMQGRAAAA